MSTETMSTEPLLDIRALCAGYGDTDVLRGVDEHLTVDYRTGGAPHREPQRVEHGGPEPSVAHREGTNGVAVIGAPERQVRVATGHALVRPVLHGDPQGLLHRGGAIRGEQEMGADDRDHRSQRFGQLNHHTVAVAQQR